ncbi:hypothetical protein ACFQJC_00505 [Haloferax namakaokahaiae]|uniref:MYM-type domain-containing protein n=1 Tax=Haloferax namakaokahaiae TaxID=1748331 RepID=A0ABD5ZAC4_9EURY
MTECAYCGNEVEYAEPVFIEELRSGMRISTGSFCDYDCLLAYLEARRLAPGR